MPSFCTTIAEFRSPTANEDGSFTLSIAGDSALHEFNYLKLKDLSVSEYMARAAPPVLLDHGWNYELPVAITKQLCYDANSDSWQATFVFIENDEKSQQCRNLFEQGMLYPSISWYVDELAKDHRNAQKKMLEWSLTATPRDTTVLNNFHKPSENMKEDAKPCKECEEMYSQAQLDQALEKQREEFSRQLQESETNFNNSQERFHEVKSSFEDMKESLAKTKNELQTTKQEFAALKDAQRSEKLIQKYALLLPDGSESKTSEGVLRDACGAMIKEDQAYGINELIQIADELLLERTQAVVVKAERFSHLPQDPYDIDTYTEFTINKI